MEKLKRHGEAVRNKLETGEIQSIETIDYYSDGMCLTGLLDELYVGVEEEDCNERTMLLRIVTKALIEENSKVIDGIIDFKMFALGMKKLRKIWAVQAGAGSQNEDITLHKKIAESVLAMSKDEYLKVETKKKKAQL